MNAVDFLSQIYNTGHVFIFQIHSDTDSTTFPIKIISAKTETKSRDTTYSVEFETETKLEARAIWFSIFKGQKYPIVCKYSYSLYYT